MANKSTTGQKHPYHLVDPSPLPFLSSIAGLAMAAGLVFYMHYGTSWLLILGTIGLLTCLLYTSPSPRDKRQSRMPSSA